MVITDPTVNGPAATPSRADALVDGIRKSLDRGERLLWTGFPRQGLMFRASDVGMIPFSLMWGGFAIFWESTVLSMPKAPAFFVLWGVPFVAMGLYIMFGRFFADAWIRARTVYAVTDQHVLILSQTFRTSLRSLDLPNLSEINCSDGSNGAGTITFGPTNFYTAMRGWPGTRRNESPAFEGIPRVRDVLSLIHQAQRDAVKTRAR